MKWLLILLLCAPCFGQSWSGILASPRAENWAANAGLPATLPDGETTTNPWTPPTGRTQCGSTLSSPSVATVNTDLAACAAGTYLLFTGTITVNGSSPNLQLYVANGGSTSAPGAGLGGVTLRGEGPMTSTIALTGTANIQFGLGWNNQACSWTAGFSQGATSITLGSCTGPALSAGEIVFLNQCNSGLSGMGCGTGTPVDNGQVYVCGGFTAGNFTDICQVAGEGQQPLDLQQQAVYISNISGTCSSSCTVTIGSPLYMPNWTSSAVTTASAVTSNAGGGQANPYGLGLEDLTVDLTAYTGTTPGINFQQDYASWVKGIRVIGQNANATSATYLQNSNRCLIFNSYYFTDAITRGDLSNALQTGGGSDNLVLNNILTGGVPWEGFNGTEGEVTAYNYSRDTQTLYNELNFFQHVWAGYQLYEGNESGELTDDDTHSSHDFNTRFRNYVSGWDPPYQYTSVCASTSCNGIKQDAYSRFGNTIANAVGSAYITNYESTPLNGITNNAAFRFSDVHNDPLTQLSNMLWGNCDTATNTCRFNSSEVPSGLDSYNGYQQALSGSGTGPYTATLSNTPCLDGQEQVISSLGIGEDAASNGTITGTDISSGTVNCATGAVLITYSSAPSGTVYINYIVTTGTTSAYANSLPSNDNIPCSFFLAGFTSSGACPLYASGGTGLSFWRVCTSWTTFPTSCSGTTTPYFPIAGPDVASGSYVNGHAYDNAAEHAFATLPIDTAYQSSYAISSYSWSGGVETITLAAGVLPNGSAHIMGGFQITGATGACNTSGAPGGYTENVMTGSSPEPTANASATTITYALASNPGACSGGNMLFPDVRQFDERVYETDTASSVNPGTIMWGVSHDGVTAH